jgi:dihydrofolate reductase
MRIELPAVAYVVARSVPDGIIGRENVIPWHLRTDLQRFKAITLGHPVIMGRKTFLSIGRPLAGRPNIVLSRSSGLDPGRGFDQNGDAPVIYAGDRETALYVADVLCLAGGHTELFVIGGAEVYGIFEDIVDKLYLTEVQVQNALGHRPTDAVFDYEPTEPAWRTLESHEVPAGPRDDFPSRYMVLERRARRTRTIDLKRHDGTSGSAAEWLNEQMITLDRISQENAMVPITLPYRYELG